MGALDWLDVGLQDHHVEADWWKGSFSVTMGDALLGTFGSYNSHTFGSQITLVADPEEILFGKIAEAIPLVSALVGGIGGSTTFVYGSTTTATYLGPATEIRRAPSISKTTKYQLPRVGDKMTGAGDGATDPIDMALCVAVGALSALIVLVPAVMELVIRFKYSQYGQPASSSEHSGSGSGEGHGESEGQGRTPEILKTCACMITTRLMGLLKMLETKGSLLQWGDRLLFEGIALVFSAALLLTIPFAPVMFWSHRYRELVEKELESLEAIQQALAL
jgi:hypothetical protein